jgi:hypothetical protein
MSTGRYSQIKNHQKKNANQTLCTRVIVVPGHVNLLNEGT